MKNFIKPALLFLCIAAFAACKKNEAAPVEEVKAVNPISDYTITADANDAFTYHFKSLAKDHIKQEWRFGDDTLSVASEPTHTYRETGDYQVDLMTYSKTGNVSHKYFVLKIRPDSVFSINTAKTGVANQLQFGVNLKGTVKSVEWTFNAVNPTNNAVTTTKTTALNPAQLFAFGSFNNFSVTATTTKGSTATLTRNVTTDGIVTDITQSYVSFKSTNENTVQGPGEGSLKMVDGNTQTKFGYYSAFPVQQIATLEFPAQVAVKMYSIENGNDSESRRDPKEWYIEGSNDNTNWETVDHQLLTIGFADYLTSIGQNSTRYFRFFYYPVANPKPFKFYRWRITSVFGTAFQIMEFRLYK